MPELAGHKPTVMPTHGHHAPCGTVATEMAVPSVRRKSAVLPVAVATVGHMVVAVLAPSAVVLPRSRVTAMVTALAVRRIAAMLAVTRVRHMSPVPVTAEMSVAAMMPMAIPAHGAVLRTPVHGSERAATVAATALHVPMPAVAMWSSPACGGEMSAETSTRANERSGTLMRSGGRSASVESGRTGPPARLPVGTTAALRVRPAMLLPVAGLMLLQPGDCPGSCIIAAIACLFPVIIARPVRAPVATIAMPRFRLFVITILGCFLGPGPPAIDVAKPPLKIAIAERSSPFCLSHLNFAVGGVRRRRRGGQQQRRPNSQS
jgi:hypothetical protein